MIRRALLSLTLLTLFAACMALGALDDLTDDGERRE